MPAPAPPSAVSKRFRLGRDYVVPWFPTFCCNSSMAFPGATGDGLKLVRKLGGGVAGVGRYRAIFVNGAAHGVPYQTRKSQRRIKHQCDRLAARPGKPAVWSWSRSVDDTIQVRCTKCKGSFRDRARRVQSGYSRQCPNCEVIIFFEEGAIDRNVQLALRNAKRLRRELRAADEIRPSSAPRVYVHRR